MKNRLKALDVTIENLYGKNYTLKSYFIELMTRLWEEEEGFSGKRPLGDSGWQYDVARALVQAGFIKGTLDEDGFLYDYNRFEFMKLINYLIKHMFEGLK